MLRSQAKKGPGTAAKLGVTTRKVPADTTENTHVTALEPRWML